MRSQRNSFYFLKKNNMQTLEKWTLYRSYYEAWKFMPNEQRLEYYEKLFAYIFDWIETNSEWIVEAVFQAVKPNIKCSRERAIVWAVWWSVSKNAWNKNASKIKAKSKQNQSNDKENDKENIEVEELNITLKHFGVFWEKYPNKIGKPNAQKKYKHKHHEEIIEWLTSWSEYWKRSGTEKKYIPHPATWLNQERWRDKPPDTAEEPKILRLINEF